MRVAEHEQACGKILLRGWRYDLANRCHLAGAGQPLVTYNAFTMR